jgi:hypothetical protein
MTILPVESQDELGEFVEFAWVANSGDPSWVPPLREQVYRDLSAVSPLARYCQKRLFLCQDNGRTVGRIAALCNQRLTDGDGTVLGQLGYFECLDDSAAATALIDTGLAWLRAQGARSALAPMNGGAHKGHRLMTSGFDRDPFLFEPRNPPYYPKMLAQAGFTPVQRWFTYEHDRAQAHDLLARYDRVLARRPLKGAIDLLGPAGGQDVVVRIHRLLDKCWGGHAGYAHVDLDEFAEIFGPGLAIMSPGNVGVLTNDGQDWGYTFSFPDYVADVRALGGHAAGWGRWLGTSRPDRLVLHTSALVPDVRTTSAAIALIGEALRLGLAGPFDRFILALAIEGFMNRAGEPTREYALFGRPIA